MPRSILPLLLVAWVVAPVRAQMPPPEAPAKHAVARRVDPGGIRVDGRLDEDGWARAAFISDFRTKEPVENGEPGDRTEVAFLYDDRSLYVGARLLSRNPRAVPRALTRRDQYGDSEHITISLDPYLDRRTAYSFSITSSGVRRDYYHPRDGEGFGDRDFTFDPVWQARVAFDSTGWTAELRIPFSQLRFNNRPIQQWGLNVNRWIPNRNEDIYWVVVPRAETGFASRFGTLSGIEAIRSSRRLEITPYAATDARFRGNPDPADPFGPTGRSFGARAGADFKMGLGPNVTLDATVNPDFGQVEADPAEVNLTAFETFFEERRPFFTEGSQLLRGTASTYFYSRRIGERPRGELGGDYVDRPDHTTILSAAKLTGRLASGLSIGALTAVADREYGRTYSLASHARETRTIEPLAEYGVVRAQQQFGRSGSTVGAIVSGVNRSLGSDTLLTNNLSRRAVAGAVDWVLRFQRGRYELSGNVGGSYLDGDSVALRRIQESPARYLQRPDYRHAQVDPRATSMRGFQGRVRLDKNAGDWLFGTELATESPGFETNDMGRVRNTDDVDFNADVNRRWNRPGRVFRRATAGLFTSSNWNYDGVRTFTALRMFSRFTLRNFTEISVNGGYSFRSLSDDLTRGGPLMGTGGAWSGDVGIGSNFAKPTQWRVGLAARAGEQGDWSFRVSAGIALRPLAPISLSIDPTLVRSLDVRQYVATIDDPAARTFGHRYVFGAIRQSLLSARIRLNYVFAPDLTVEAYAEPFAASGRYDRYGELASARSRELREYGSHGTGIVRTGTDYRVTDEGSGSTFSFAAPDFNALSFRSNVVLRWEWRPGSTLFLVWQQSRATFCSPTSPLDCRNGLEPGTPVGLGSIGDALRAAGDNFIAVKVSYWLAVR